MSWKGLHSAFRELLEHLGSCFNIILLFLNKFSAILGRIDVGSPFLCISLGLDLEFVGHSLTLKFPVIFIDCRMDNLLLFVNSRNTDVFLIIQVIFVSHFCLINQLFIIIAFVSLLIRFCFVPASNIGYCAVSSYLGFLKEKFLRLRALVAS
jgi:hypothetical protein